MDVDQAINAFAALSTPSRVEILRLLAAEGSAEGMKSGDIAERLKVAQNTLSTQLMTLSHARLVRSRRQGRSIFYRLDQETLQSLSGFLLKDCGGKAAARTQNAA